MSEAANPPLIPKPFRPLCRMADIPDGGAKRFPAKPGEFTGVFAVRRGEAVFVYVNACPHIGTPLDWVPDKFLSADGTQIVCATHGALFRIEDGVCTSGPCRGDVLERVPMRMEDDLVLIQD